MSALFRRLDAAVALAGEAGALAVRMRPGRGTPAAMKGRQDWLTEADGAVERFLSERLAALFPADGFQGEEGGTARGGALRWVVDPIDGTSNYAHGGARWCVSLGLLDGDRVVAGVLAAPALGETYAAAEGRGATLNGMAIRAADTVDLSRAIVEAGWSPRVREGDYLALCQRLMAAGVMLRNGGSGALGLAEVAAGRLDGYVERHINLWDCAGALAVLQEAGAGCSPFVAAYATGGGPLLAAAPGVADALMAVAELPLAG